MKILQLLKILERLDFYGVYVFSKKMFKNLLSSEKGVLLDKTLDRAVKEGVIVRVCRGVYVLPDRFAQHPYKLEAIANILRAGEYTYVSLESALSEYSIISQMLLSHITLMTTGRKQSYETAFGTIEFIHTNRNEFDILRNTIAIPNRPLRLAKASCAHEDLRRVNRNLYLVNFDILEEVISEQSKAI